MVENQALAWKKLKQKDADVKTKDQVEADMIKKSQAAENTRQQGRYNDDGGYGGGGRGRGGGDRRNDRGGDNRDNRRDDRRDGEKVYMKKQDSMASNTSGGGRGGARRQ